MYQESEACVIDQRDFFVTEDPQNLEDIQITEAGATRKLVQSLCPVPGGCTAQICGRNEAPEAHNGNTRAHTGNAFMQPNTTQRSVSYKQDRILILCTQYMTRDGCKLTPACHVVLMIELERSVMGG